MLTKPVLRSVCKGGQLFEDRDSMVVWFVGEGVHLLLLLLYPQCVGTVPGTQETHWMLAE